MDLSGAELFRYSIRYKNPVAIKDATLHRRTGALIRLTADDGAEAWGETAPLPGFSPESLDDAIGQLQTALPSQVGREVPLEQAIADNAPIAQSSDLTSSACFGLETALLNLSARSSRKSLPELLTDQPRDVVNINGLISGSIDKMLADAESLREAGYRVVKLKVGRRSVAEDVELVRRVAEMLGDDVSLRLDANRAWDFAEAGEFAGGVAGVRIEYVEEPLVEPGRLAELVPVWGLPVALDESLVGMTPEGLEGHRYARAVVLKPTLLGGISRAVRFVEKAKDLGMAPVVSSSYESGVGTGALVALAAVGGEPAGLDTYRGLAEDVVEAPLPLFTPEIDVGETMDAARRVDVGRLEPIPIP